MSNTDRVLQIFENERNAADKLVEFYSSGLDFNDPEVPLAQNLKDAMVRRANMDAAIERHQNRMAAKSSGA